MSRNHWKTIWDKRVISGEVPTTLERLIRLDGFDTGAGRIEVADWEAYAERVAQRLGVQQGDSVFEVGCGSGAFLYPFWKQGIRVGGIDYSRILIREAQRAMRGGEFACGEAVALEIEPRYDVIIANGVFHYFLDFGYAQDVIDRMLCKAKRRVAILDVPDKEKEEAAEDERRSRLAPHEYDKKYKNLLRLYYRKEWFVAVGHRYGFQVEIFDQEIPSYGNSEFHFNVLITV